MRPSVLTSFISNNFTEMKEKKKKLSETAVTIKTTVYLCMNMLLLGFIQIDFTKFFIFCLCFCGVVLIFRSIIIVFEKSKESKRINQINSSISFESVMIIANNQYENFSGSFLCVLFLGVYQVILIILYVDGVYYQKLLLRLRPQYIYA